MTDKEKLSAAIETLEKCRNFIAKFQDTHPVNMLLYKIDEVTKEVSK